MPAPPSTSSSPSPASTSRCIVSAAELRRIDQVAAAQRRERAAVDRVGVGHRHGRRLAGRSSRRRRRRRRPSCRPRSRAVRRTTLSTTPSAPATPRAPPSSTLIAVDLGAAEVVDLDEVAAAEGVEVDLLDAAGVHDDVADVAGEDHPARRRASAANVSLPAAPLNVITSMPAAALDGVAPVARVPDELVVAAGRASPMSLPRLPSTVSLSGPAAEVLGAGTAEHQVVAAPAAGSTSGWCR